MDLPEKLEEALSADLIEFEKEKMMPYVSSIERIGIRKGNADALLRLLTKRFHTPLPAELETRIGSSRDLAELDTWIDASAEASDLSEFRRMCGI